LIFGESDGFPGLTVDRFNNLLSVQILSFGMDKRKDVILPMLADALRRDGMPVDGIYIRNDVAIRSLEGLEQYKGWFPGYEGPSTLTQIVENGVHYHVDVENGQKTGFFLDQRLNRRALAGIAKGKTVLDCFTHTGSFAFNALMGGAARVTAVDISEEAVSTARKNAELNDFSDKGQLDFLCADVFDLLPALEKEGKSPYDLIILDPPAFTKSRKTVKNAERGYKEINYRAMKLLPRGGYLATCSCSHFMENSLFVKMLHDAAHDAGVSLRQIEARQQAPDHPILMNVPETDYLKFYLFQIV
jgi:23S rRNA (cytosine1962-C5)-methyltransferase